MANSIFKLLLYLLPLACSFPPDTSLPNIVVVRVKDTDFSSLSHTKSVLLKDALDNDVLEYITPGFNSLKWSGIIFDSFYVEDSQSIMKRHHGQWEELLFTGIGSPVSTQKKNPVISKVGSSTLSNKLKQQGYSTLGVGKWPQSIDHVSSVFQRYFDIWDGELDKEPSPNRVVSMTNGSFTFSPYSIKQAGDMKQNLPNKSELREEERHMFDLYTETAIDFMKDHIQQFRKDVPPFFMHLSFEGHKSSISRNHFNNKTSAASAVFPASCSFIVSDDENSSQEAALCSELHQLDQSVSLLVRYLKSSNRWRDTVFLILPAFSSKPRHDNSAVLSGGFIQRNMAARGVVPYVFSSVMDLANIHDMISALAFSDMDTVLNSPNSSDEGVARGFNMLNKLIPKQNIDWAVKNPLVLDSSNAIKAENRRLASTSFEVLSLLYESTDGSNWDVNTNWMKGEPCPSGLWEGITCDSSGVYSVVTMDNQLRGTLPSELGLLSTVRIFALHQNYLVGSIPSELGALTSMVSSFRLSENMLTGSIPSQLGRMTLIAKRFDLNNNWLSNSIPSQLGQLTAMTQNLRLYSNRLSSNLPSQFGTFTAMTKSMMLSSNSFTGSIPSQFGALTALTGNLELFSNQLSGTIPTFLGLLVSLKQALELHSNSLTGNLPSQFGNLISMTDSFHLYSNLLCGTIPIEVELLSSQVSGSWDVSTGNSLGTHCCETLPLVYTSCAPSPIPSPIPSSLPTSIPTHSPYPTSLPTPPPSLQPTSIPLPVPTSTPTNTPSSLPSTSQSPTLTANPTNLPTTSPTLQPVPVPTLLPSTVPTSTPTSRPSFIPSLVPSSQPSLTSSPTLLPFPQPSTTPTNTPTLLPTSAPSSFPTGVPTPFPTLMPSSLPSPFPSPSPTITPTLQCESGSYFDGTNCQSCAIGKYSNITGAPFPSSCSFCPSGQYSTTVGAITCIDCARGKLSSDDRTFCEDCEVGQYSNGVECVSCEQGRYAPQPLSNACLLCPNGSYTNNHTGSISCTACSAGKYAHGSSTTCEKCPTGKFSSSGVGTCTDCTAGRVSSMKGSTTCIACSAGKYAPFDALSNCTSCPVGKFQDSTGQQACVNCESGRYGNSIGLTVCSYCINGRSSKSGAESCNLAREGYYFSTLSREDSIECPRQSTCHGGVHTPIPKKGFWIDHSKYEYAGKLYRCVGQACQGVSNSSKCYTMNHFNDTECQDFECRKGSKGPLCGSCFNGFIRVPGSNTCEPCEETMIFALLIIASLCSFFIIIVFLLSKGKLEYAKHLVSKMAKSVDTGTLKVLWVSYQIIASSSFTLNISFPEPFNSMLDILQVFSFNLAALECIYFGMKTYFSTIYLWCVLPLLFGLLILCGGLIRIFGKHTMKEVRTLWNEKNNIESDSQLYDITMVRKSVRSIFNQHVYLLLVLSYLVLPAVVNRQLQIFDCIELESGQSFIRADTATMCTSDTYYMFRRVVICFIALYQLIPIGWFLILYQNKQALQPFAAKYDDDMATFIRNNNPNLVAFRFLFIDYKCSKWWFEIADMYRRIMYIGLLPLISSEPATRASFGLLLSILSLAYFSCYEPYQAHITNLIAFIAQVSILVTFYAALTLESVSLMIFGLRGRNLGLFLVCVDLMIVMLAAFFALNGYREKKLVKEQAESRASQFILAMDYDAVRFKAVLDNIQLNEVASTTEVMVFYYCSSIQAKRARKFGLSALKRFNGIPFTLRRPHETNSNDFQVFNTCNEKIRQHRRGEEEEEEIVSKTEISNDGVVSNSSDLHVSTTASVSSGSVNSSSNSSTGSNSMHHFPHQEMLVLSLPRQFLDPLLGFDHDPGLCLLSADILKAMRPIDAFHKTPSSSSSSSSSVNSSQSAEKKGKTYGVVLPPHTILRSFLVMEKSESEEDILDDVNMYEIISPPASTEEDHSNHSQSASTSCLQLNSKISFFNSISAFTAAMVHIRQQAYEAELIPLYHYTSLAAAQSILKRGIRLPRNSIASSQQSYDYGEAVYFTSRGPCAFGIHSMQYEVNIIKDLFGAQKLSELKGKHLFEVVIVYGCCARVIQQEAKRKSKTSHMCLKSTFIKFSSPNSKGEYYLRKDRILGAFVIQLSSPVKHKSDLDAESSNEAKAEKNRDYLNHCEMKKSDHIRTANRLRLQDFASSSESTQLSSNNSSNINSITIKPSHSVQEDRVSDGRGGGGGGGGGGGRGGSSSSSGGGGGIGGGGGGDSFKDRYSGMSEIRHDRLTRAPSITNPIDTPSSQKLAKQASFSNMFSKGVSSSAKVAPFPVPSTVSSRHQLSPLKVVVGGETFKPTIIPGGIGGGVLLTGRSRVGSGGGGSASRSASGDSLEGTSVELLTLSNLPPPALPTTSTGKITISSSIQAPGLKVHPNGEL